MLELNQSLQEQFDRFFNEVMDGGVLNDREKVVAILVTATLSGNQEAVKNAVLAAKQIGFNNEELGHIHALTVAANAQTLKNLSGWQAPEVSNQSKSVCCY